MSLRPCVVIPHHSRAALLLRALESVRGWPVLVVDDSPGGLLLPPGAPPATVIRAGGSSGFARAANLGLAAAQVAGHGWALLLNDDAAPAPGCIEALVATASADPSIAAAGPVLVGARGVESAGLRYSERTGRLRQRTRVPTGARSSKPRDVDALSGACLLIPARLRFDEGYPHGFEDVALALALRRGGGRVVLVPWARCLHVGGASLDRRSRAAARAAVRGHLRLVGASRPRRAAVIGYALAQVIRERGPAARVLGIWEGWRLSGGRLSGESAARPAPARP